MLKKLCSSLAAAAIFLLGYDYFADLRLTNAVYCRVAQPASQRQLKIAVLQSGLESKLEALQRVLSETAGEFGKAEIKLSFSPTKNYPLRYRSCNAMLMQLALRRELGQHDIVLVLFNDNLCDDAGSIFKNTLVVDDLGYLSANCVKHLLLHELGHFFYLRHSDLKEDVMYKKLHYNYPPESMRCSTEFSQAQLEQLRRNRHRLLLPW